MSWSSSSRRVSNFSDLIQRVTASCLLHPLADQSQPATRHSSELQVEEDRSSETTTTTTTDSTEEEEKEDSQQALLTWQVFDAVSDLKRAYGALQVAHCPWDLDRIRAADEAVVAELRKLGGLKERFRRNRNIRNVSAADGGGSGTREVVAPYEAAVEELKRELKAKEVEIDNLKAKIKGRKDRSDFNSKRKVALYCSAATHVTGSPTPELFESTMSSVIKASKSFTAVLLSLMRSANWDMAAAARSVLSATISTTTSDPIVGPHHAKYAIESYISHKIFQGFDHETFYMDGSLSSLIDPDRFRRNCFAQYRDMQGTDPAVLLGIMPSCPFGKFCAKKYLEIIHAKMEESLFGGDLEQRRQVASGTHPRTHFYGQFLGLAKAVWLLHLLAFSLDPPPTRFEAAPGAEFHPHLMENILGNSDGCQLVGFPVTPGFKLGNGSVIKARGCLMSRGS